MNNPLALADFAGGWILSRRIEDRRAKSVLTGTGGATFALDQYGLVYDETVTLDVPGQGQIRGERRYLWRAEEDGISVAFASAAPFHRISLGRPQPGDRHDCPPDVYTVTYDFQQWPDWSAHWDVEGPRKDYSMMTRYQRDASVPTAKY